MSNIFKSGHGHTIPSSPFVNLEETIDSLKAKLAILQEEHQQLQEELSLDEVSDNGVRMYEREMKSHIRQLKMYNELKDTSMRLIQMIADQKQTTIREVMQEMGVEDDK